MGFVSDAVQGVFGGGGQGATFQAQGPTAQAVTDAQGQTNQALANQQGFVNAINMQTPGAIAAQMGLAQQLQAQAAGQGPNPAQAALAQSTGANVANQAALMASQRGAGANVGLVARQAAQAGAGAQQQAAGQAATLQAQQQLAAQQALGNLSATQIGQAGSGYGQQTSNTLTNQGQLLNAQGQQQASNAGIANTNAKGGQQAVGGLLNGAAAAFSMADGGEVPAVPTSNPLSYAGKFAQGFGSVYSPASVQGQPIQRMGDESGGYQAGQGMGRLLGGGAKKLFGSGGPDSSNANVSIESVGDSGVAPLAEGVASVPLSQGGKVKAMVSPGEIYVPPKEVKKVAEGKETAKEAGKVIPGKPKVKGDSIKNDTVHAALEAGGVVVPRTKNSEEQARQFVAQVRAKQASKRASK